MIHELPNLRFFHTLSPIPKFKEWLDLKLSFAAASDPSDEKLIANCLTQQEIEVLKSASNSKSIAAFLKSHINSRDFREKVNKGENALDEISQAVASFLRRICAHYLYAAKKNGFAFNSVCNFHIKNGAQIYRINFGADLSEHGWSSSYTLMANYGYYLGELDYNSVGYLTNKNIKISDHVKELLLVK